jgi:hypothetical protein
MHMIEATCPHCQATDQYGDELIGRYTLCTSCHCRFYIEVPPLGEAQGKPALSGAPITPASSKSTTLDDLLMDTQQGTRFLIATLHRQETLLKWQGYGLLAVIGLLLVLLVVLMVRTS